MSVYRGKIKVLKVWLVIIAALLVFMITITCVLTQVNFLYNTINSAVGGERRYLVSGDPSEYQYYKSDYASKEDTLAAANTLNENICGEGFVLLKNESSALPMKDGGAVTVFGYNSQSVVLGGSGSNKGDLKDSISDVNESLNKAGFKCNPVIADYYANASVTAKPEVSMGTILTGYPVGEATLPYSQAVRDSYKQYGDAAIVVISRMGGEGFDLPRTMFWNGSNYKTWTSDNTMPVPGARSADDHYLQLDANETDMLKEACDNFEKVIVVVNSASPMELGFLDDPEHYAYQPNISAALWIGNPGNSGLNALGEVLKGEINPSGRLVDVYARNFKNDPSWENFGNYLQNEGNRYTYNGKSRNAYFVEYREGIYVGYRYYETMFAEKNALSPDSGEEWYRENVVYPFGYGLSYSDFEWTVDIPADAKINLTADGEINIDVTVKNVGNCAGKDVVQLYYTPPYTPGEIEKAHVTLGDFIKTDLLEPGEEKKYTLSLPVRDMASYDYADANGNGFKGYELDAGTYTVSVMRNSHSCAQAFEYTLVAPVRYEYSDVNPSVRVENRFDDVSEKIKEYLSRENCFLNYGVLSGASEASNREVDQAFIDSLTWSLKDESTDPWYVDIMPETKGESELQLYALIGKQYNDPLWDELVGRLSVSQMQSLISIGNYRTIQIEEIGKPLTIDSDGPMGFASYMGDGAVYGTCYYASECVLAATWNTALAEAFGEMIGNEGLWGDQAGDGRTYSGWYAPAVNLHRSPFGGRNFEYYSEDPYLSGKMAEWVIKGAAKKGVYTYVKHFALNDQETNRDTTGLVTWANEQAMRELYFKPFERSVKQGKTSAMMSSFNRIGSEWTGGSYRLLTSVLREEWGFEGMVITDFNLKSYMNIDQMIRAGGDLNLSPEKKISSTQSATDVSVMRQACKNILFTVVNSNAMNGIGEGVKWGYGLPWWVIWLIVATCAIFLVAVSLAVTIYFTIKKEKRTDEGE